MVLGMGSGEKGAKLTLGPSSHENLEETKI